MFLFGKKPKSVLGVDIGGSAIKLVELSKEEGRYKLKNYGIFSLVDYFQATDRSVQELTSIPYQEIATIIKAIIKEANINTKTASLSVPVYSSFITLIDLPNMSEKEIAAAISFEAKKYIPVPVSEVVLDWSLVAPANEKKSGQQVLLIAVPKEIITRYNQIVQLSGLRVRTIEEETFSLTRSLIGNDKSTTLLIDIGARSTNVGIVDRGYIRVTHNLEIGGNKMTQTLAKQTGFDLEKAEEIKKGLLAGQSNESQARFKGLMYSVLDSIVLEVRKIVDGYQVKYGRKIDRCILVGGGARTFGLVDYFKSKLAGLEVVLANPFARVIAPPLLEPVLKELGPSLAVAVGLAMRE